MGAPGSVIRDDHVQNPSEAGALRSGDYACLAPPEFARRLDRLFARPAPLSDSEAQFFGDVVFEGDLPLDTLVRLYDLVAAEDWRTRTMVEIFAGEFAKHPAVGDRLELGTAALIAREVEAGRVTKARLQLDASPPRARYAAQTRRSRKLLPKRRPQTRRADALD
jgi:cell volume regulation protein A